MKISAQPDPGNLDVPMIVALACTPPTETVWKTKLRVGDQRTRGDQWDSVFEPTLPWQVR